VSQRDPQLAYSDLQPAMHDEAGRRKKADKIIAVLTHFLGRGDLSGLRVLDLGSSTGYIADELRRAGGSVAGIDIDRPGLSAAEQRFGLGTLLCTDGARMPFADESFDVVVFNQIYEHVVDPDAVMAEIRRVLAPAGAAYLGLGNRLQVIEPHHKLPGLSYLPTPVADRYLRLAGKGDHYYERFRTKPGLRRLCAGLTVWDYTRTVLAESRRFAADDMVPARLADIPPIAWTIVEPIIPTYLGVGSKSTRPPAGQPTRVAPHRVSRVAR
jgi:SAM-dependent methyltransferase